MIGPVLHQELLLGSRRNKLHILRWIYAGWLVVYLVSMFLYFLMADTARCMELRMAGREAFSASAPLVVGCWFADSFVTQQLILLMVITPPFVAGAVTDEKRRGTLQYLLLTDMESRHIILGKLVGRVALLGLVMLTGLPLFAVCAGFGGIDFVPVVVTGAALVMPIVGLASATLLASVWCRQTRDAVLAVYVVGIVLIGLVLLVGGPLEYLNPLFVHAPAWQPTGNRDLAETGTRLLYSALAWGSISAVCLGLAIARLRAAYIREIESVRPTKTPWYAVDRVPVNDEPIRWRERHVEGLAPFYLLRRIPTWFAITSVALLTTASSLAILYFNLPKSSTPDAILRALLSLNLARLLALLPDASEWFLAQAVVAMLVASFFVGVRLSGAITSEREKQTWEAVLLTPLSARLIIRGKLWGVLGASMWYMLAYAAPAVIFSALSGPAAVIFTLLGLAVTCLVMYFIGATGLYCSATCKSSWRALFMTMAVAYVGGLVLYVVTSPVMAIIAFFLWVALQLMDYALGTTAGRTIGNNAAFFPIFIVSSWIGLAVIFFWLAKLFLDRSLRWIADRERTRHWHDEPIYRRSGRGREIPRLTHDY
jgi:ABC-type transport system involved in multi-copper enzyme maturation permease subunit